MRKHLVTGGFLAGLMALGFVAAQDSSEGVAGAQSGAPFRLSSAYVVDGMTAPATIVGSSRACGMGRNISPQLTWTGVPDGTKSLALSVFDPDARQGQGFWHWLVYNIPASAMGLEAGAGGNAVMTAATSAATSATSTYGSSAASAALPTGALPDGAVNGANGTGRVGYTGPCPPAADAAHHYVFTLYALDVDSISLPEGATGATLPAAVEGHTLGTATLTALYAAPKPAEASQ